MLKHWRYKFVLGIALIAGGAWTIYVGQQRSTTLLAIDTNTGKIQWVQPLGGARNLYSRGAIAANGTVVLGLGESSSPESRLDIYRLRAFDVRSGNPLWTTALNSPADGTSDAIGYWFASTYAIDLQPNAVYAQMGDELQSLDPRTGQKRWAIKRPWLDYKDRPLRFGLGIAATEELLAVLQLKQNQRSLLTIDANTGKVIRQTAIPFKNLEETNNRITARNRLAFLETSGRIPVDNGSLSNGRSTITAYNLDTGQVRFRVPITGGISNLQAFGQTIQLSTDPVINYQRSAIDQSSQFMGLALETGRTLWKKSVEQIQCGDFGWSWRVDAESVYFNCRQPKQYSSTIFSLSAKTGQIQWQTLVSPNGYSDKIPVAIAPRQLLTFRNVSQSNQSQTQVIALDRQTGRLLWSVPLFDAQYMNAFRAIVTVDQEKVFILDVLPQWQLWLLKLNRDWYLNRAIEVKS
ncbi:outer membrane protein assembly factor BamB family protein [Leptolyngbya sp. NIES-2104]|uniref:outer membrane protein assembly factor BamB family protein n=1 Tax=Leptolyngbya sp. NIES-2104 TaxID=1552121 RepID=UPI0006ECAFA6|nr:PQQ-binding-like beta-propeller repeat protein [Leptolyngbya sp. NIES-2104]GAP95522.1 hypothetical protein NIES2104_20440 [Leptolyngbya sp. NIES-2104]